MAGWWLISNFLTSIFWAKADEAFCLPLRVHLPWNLLEHTLRRLHCVLSFPSHSLLAFGAAHFLLEITYPHTEEYILDMNPWTPSSPLLLIITSQDKGFGTQLCPLSWRGGWELKKLSDFFSLWKNLDLNLAHWLQMPRLYFHLCLFSLKCKILRWLCYAFLMLGESGSALIHVCIRTGGVNSQYLIQSPPTPALPSVTLMVHTGRNEQILTVILPRTCVSSSDDSPFTTSTSKPWVDSPGPHVIYQKS